MAATMKKVKDDLDMRELQALYAQKREQANQIRMERETILSKRTDLEAKLDQVQEECLTVEQNLEKARRAALYGDADQQQNISVLREKLKEKQMELDECSMQIERADNELEALQQHAMNAIEDFARFRVTLGEDIAKAMAKQFMKSDGCDYFAKMVASRVELMSRFGVTEVMVGRFVYEHILANEAFSKKVALHIDKMKSAFPKG